MAAQRDLVLGTAGHIDHGKTALVRALTGVDTDRLPAEKQRGITIDLGFAALELGDTRLALIDVPGHERFIRNMLAGATGLDLALLVVAADDSVMPQTREHLEILRLLGLPAGVVALTKCDLSEPDWLDLVEGETRALVAGTFLEGAPIVRTSAQSGQGVDELRSTLQAVAARLPDRGDSGLFRLAVDRAFTVAGHGTVVTGTVASGSVAVGDDLEWFPAGQAVRVRGIQRHERPADRVGRGARAAINLAGVRHTEIQRGHELATPGYLEASRVLTVDLQSLEDAPRPLRHRTRYRLHLGTAELTATLVLLEDTELRPGAAGVGQLLLAEPSVAVYGQPFVLREESPPATLGGGRVIMPTGRRVRRRDRRTVTRIGQLRTEDTDQRLETALTLRGLQPCTDPELSRLTGLALQEIPPALARLASSGVLQELPLGSKRSVRLLTELTTDLEDRVLRALARLHAARPRLSAVPRAHLATALADLGDDALLAALIERLRASGQVMTSARTVALKGHEPKLSQGERRLKNELAETFHTRGLNPPDSAELATLAGARANALPDLLALLCEEERLVEIAIGLFLDYEVEASIRRSVHERLADGSALTMAELRDLLGTTRKYAVPIGEHLDRIGLTKRDGDVRRLGAADSA